MNIYALKNKIKRLQALNDPKQRYWVEFLQDLYNKQLQAMADKDPAGIQPNTFA
jgi:hypothetical protein